jgi:Condensation domain.
MSVASCSKQVQISAIQKRFWTLARLGMDEGAYNVPVLLDIKGHLNTDAFAEAFLKLISRHAVLHTILSSDQHGNPAGFYAEIVREKVLDEPKIYEDRQVALALANQFLEKPFDVATDLPARCFIAPYDNGCLVALCFHHHAVDEESLKIILQELFGTYVHGEGILAPKSSDAPDYCDWAAWHDEEFADQQERVLERKLNKLAPALEQNFRIGDGGDSHGSKIAFDVIDVNDTLLQKIEKLIGVNGATYHAIYTTALGITINRITGGSSCVVGSPVSQRNIEEVMGMGGLFCQHHARRCLGQHARELSRCVCGEI